MRRTGDLKLIQELNRFIILDTIRQFGPISRSDIAKKQGISPTTVTSAVNELIRDGMVAEDGTGESKGGRKPIMVRFCPDGKFLIGVSITNTAITIAEMNLEAATKQKKIYPVKAGLVSELIIQYVLDSIEDFLQSVDDVSRCLGISIIAPGIVDAASGVIRFNSKLRLHDVPLKDMAEERFGLKTWLDNDANAIALAEKNFGGGLNANNLLFVTVGEGVGSGLVVNGSIFRGSRGGAGEFGHTTVDRSGMRCDCGNVGCLENYVAWPAIYSGILSAVTRGKETLVMDLADGDMTKITFDVFRQALHQGDQVCQDIVDEIASYMSIGIVNLVNLFNPSLIILGGEMIRDNQVLFERIQKQVMAQAMGTMVEGLEFRPTVLGADFEVKAAAAVLLQDVFHFSL
ncbi:ROK family transcriptional regulator [Brevibacillus sp. HB1.4B]|uniref:ROK family transcriptional regulator n=1 Tax=Brevibacillus sp. HB1.4B TaxID=2738845 RepID=UPI00156ABB65|nr:ROK family transcriptional regulator [Brevibacillus sp. HB1.4B]NRS16540.1 ROK family transcriptional regulator [Brevibacillus sp. HB1.4B]